MYHFKFTAIFYIYKYINIYIYIYIIKVYDKTLSQFKKKIIHSFRLLHELKEKNKKTILKIESLIVYCILRKQRIQTSYHSALTKIQKLQN